MATTVAKKAVSLAAGMAVPHPPKPRLTLRVGISGHRPKPAKFPKTSFEHVKRQLRDVFAAIDTALDQLGKTNGAFYSAEPYKVRLVSGLAEGADQFAAEARPAHWELDAILPFPADSYRADFRTSAIDDRTNVVEQFEAALRKATTVMELPDDPRIARGDVTADNNPEEYQRLHDYGYVRHVGTFLRQFDVLVAVWDGTPEEGPGGTAEVVRRALDFGIPVVWISSLVDTYPRMVDDVEDEGPLAPPADCLKGSLRDAISSVVSIPAETPSSDVTPAHASTSVEQRLTDFLTEAWPKPSRWTTYDRFKRWAEFRRGRSLIVSESMENYQKSWDDFIKDAPPAGKLAARLVDVALPRYAWADALAIDLSDRFRSAYIRCYLLAALAVFVALLGIFPETLPEDADMGPGLSFLLLAFAAYLIGRIGFLLWTGRALHWKENPTEYRRIAALTALAICVALFATLPEAVPLKSDPRLVIKFLLVALECFIIGKIAFIVWIGRSGRWQERWVEYRALAEMLRDVRFLAYVGEYGYVQRAGELEPASAWFLWYLRATIREIGVPHASIDGSYQRAHLIAVGKHVIEDQIKYHKRNSKTLFRMHRFLHVTGEWSFILIGLVLLGFLVAHVVLGGMIWRVDDDPQHVRALKQAFREWGPFVTFLAALLPAVGAAIAGIRETGDFEGFAERSAKTLASLKDLEKEIEVAKRRLTLESTGTVLLSTAEVLTEDLTAWQSVFGRKRLNFPA